MGGGGRSNYKRKAHEEYTKPISNSSGSSPLFEQEDDCANFSLNTRLQNVGIALNKIKVGDVLSVKLEESDVVVVFNTNGEICGNIAHPKTPKLISCIKMGNRFVATVLSIRDIACDILVEKA
jgi:hypothetical protein